MSKCNDSCYTCSQSDFKATKKSRDMLLMIMIEKKDGIILARKSLMFWPKAVVKAKDLARKVRRKPKRGAAQI